MDEHDRAREPGDEGADTAMFRAFAERGEESRPPMVGAPFRILTLLAGLAVFAVIVVLLLR